MKALREITSQRLKAAREARGLTQADLADHLGISSDAISKIETGNSTLTLQHLEKLPGLLGQDLAYFFGIDPPLPADLTDDEKLILNAYRTLPPGSEARRFAYHSVWSLGVALREIRAEKSQGATGTNHPSG